MRAGSVRLTQQVLPYSIARNTRAYVERVANQVNRCYDKGWYDACSVMLRRLLETLTIEALEKHALSAKIKNGSCDFLYLRDFVAACIAEPTWNLGRNCRTAMPRLKGIGGKSAHSRHLVAQRGDIDPLLADIWVVVQELVLLADLKKK